VAAGFMAGVKPFIGTLKPAHEKIHLPHASMWVPPWVLAILGVVFGIFPRVFGDFIISPTLSVLTSQGEPAPLKIWHGLYLVLILSVATLAVGAIIYVLNKPSYGKLSFVGRFDALAPKTVFKKVWENLLILSTRYTNFMHNGFLRSYLLKIIIFAELLLTYELI